MESSRDDATPGSTGPAQDEGGKAGNFAQVFILNAVKSIREINGRSSRKSLAELSS